MAAGVTEPAAMRRVLLIGCGGAGKSTLARELGELLGLPVVYLDQHFWQPGWKETPKEEWIPKLRGLVDQERWLMDGNYDSTLYLRLPRADTVLFFDFPTRICVWRVLKRIWHYRGRVRPDLGPGCPERLDLGFLRWIWRFRRHDRPQIVETLRKHGAHTRLHTFKKPRDVARWKAELVARLSG